MNSNEEYLDSLLKAVTNGQGLEEDIDGSGENTEDSIDSDLTLDTLEDEVPVGVDIEAEEDAVESDISENESAEDTETENIEESTEENAEENSEVESQDNTETEEELEDLILAADSTEEVFEETDQNESDEEGFQEISDLLASAGDSDEEMLAMLGGVGDDGPSDIGFFDDDEEEESVPQEEPVVLEEDTKKKGKKSKKGKKGKKGEDADTEEADSDQEGEPEKQGIFARFINFLLEEDEDEEESNIDDLLMGEASDENNAILAEIDKENEDKKSGKKEKKKKEKKGKGKGKEASEDGEDGEEGAEENGKKAKKEKKKKEKKPKEDPVPEKPGKKISPKKIQATALFCLTLTAAIILIVLLIPPTFEKQKARDAYYDKDYVKVVEGFYGEKLSDSDELMYNRAVTILKFQRKVDAYNNYMHMGKETEALNQLIEAINRYEEIYEDAVAYNIIGEIDGLYQTVLDALQNRYGLSISRAMELYAIEDDFAYTLALESVVDGVTYAMPEPVYENPEMQPEAPVEEQPEIPVEEQSEMLPEAPVEGLPEGEVPEGTPTE